MSRSVQVERSIHEMLKDTPSMNDSENAVHTGSEPSSSCIAFKHPPTTLSITDHSGIYCVFLFFTNKSFHLLTF